MENKTVLLIPVENQVRELDAKLLLACVAAKRGLPSIIGPKREIENRIASFPRGIFLSKSLRIVKRKFFPIARLCGHEIVAWDEEALVHLPAETYFSRRLSPVGMEHISHLFAWGEDNAELWRQYPKLPPGIPIHVTGNPRVDLLRPDMLGYYEGEAAEIRKTFDDFILINTNFNHVNAFYPAQNLFQPTKKPGEEAQFGQAARGMPRAYAEGFRDHKQAVFEDFQRLIPALEKAFPETAIVVRPHPTENQAIYHSITAPCRRVQVTNEGNVVPWLMAAGVLIHNGCTTGVEAYIMRVPAISFRATVNDYYDDGFYKLPNRLSHQCFNFQELQATLESTLGGKIGAAGGPERKKLIAHYLTAQDGPLACERIVDVLETIVSGLSQSPEPVLGNRLTGWFKANYRRVRKSYRAYMPGSLKSPEFERHRYPEITSDQMEERIERFRQVLGYRGRFHLNRISDKLFRISACLGLFLCLAAWAGSAAAESFSRLELDAERVVWNELVLRAKKFTATLNVQIRLASLPTADAQGALPKSPRGTPVQPAGTRVCRLVLNMGIDSTFRAHVQILNEVWFGPKTAAVLGRIRLRQGQDDFKKTYRFTRQGVFRHRREPLNQKEILLEPQKWTDVKDSFYAYDLARLGCPQVSERLTLLYLLSAADLSENSEPLSLCVFGKRQLHRVTLRPRGLYPLTVDYLEKTVQNEVRKKGPVQALKIVVETRPMDSDLKEDEDFSLMGLHKEIVIYIDPVSRIPLQISGSTPAAGRTDLKLHQVQLRQKACAGAQQ